MGVWNWLTRSAADDARLESPAVPSSARIVVEVAERERSVDGLNSWQREQVRQIISEEIAALLPTLMSTPHATPAPRSDGPKMPTIPLGRGEPDALRSYVA
jgi:hypothetical protein